MKFLSTSSSILLAAARLNPFAQACTDCTNSSPEPITHAPAPWTLHGTVYSFTFVPLNTALPVKAYSPLERSHPSATEGQYVGLLGNIQIIRYSDSPVGPYDELLVIPGYFKYEREVDGKKVTRQAVRVSRIYVSQKYTCWNGRTNWNIPKHLAKFDWTDNPDGSTSVKVYPFDTTADPSESGPAPLPFFQAKYTPAPLIPGIPFTTDLYEYIGINATLVQAPVPEGKGAHGELPGTTQWAATVPGQKSDDTTFGYFDLDQGKGDVVQDGKNAVGDEYFPNFWPDVPRTVLGMKMVKSTITFSEPEVWDPSS